MSSPESSSEKVVRASEDARRPGVLKLGLTGLALANALIYGRSASVHHQVSQDERVPQLVRDGHARAERSDLVTAGITGGLGLVGLVVNTVPVFLGRREEEIATPPTQTP